MADMGALRTDALTKLAAGQHGAFALDQLGDIDVTRRWLDNLVRRGQVQRAAPGVYTIAGSEATWHQRLMVGLLALGDDSWVSHEAAARLHGLDRSPEGAVELTVERCGRGRVMPFVVHTTACLPKIDRVTVDGFRAVSATRTVLDLARARVSRPRLEAAIDSAVRLGLTSPTVLSTRLASRRGPGFWGVRLLDDLLVDSGGHTMLERRFLELVRRAGLPRPSTQVIHRRDGRTFARVDFMFEEYGVVIEVSGQLGHSTPRDRARDAQRRNELQDIGRKVYEYTWADVTEHPTLVARTLTARLHDAGWRR
jgi:Transcriptional regulator, AbiEi antitoxin